MHIKHLTRVAKDSARTRLSGGLFELRLAGLLNARLRAERRRRPNLNLQYLIATNMDGANPFDDVILRIAWDREGRQRVITYFFQLKHAEKADKPVTSNDLTAENISKKKKDFNLRKYFEFHKKLQELAIPSAEGLQGNQRLLQEWAQGDFRFVLFTTREVLPKSKGKRATSALDFPFEEILSTNQGEVFSFGKTDENVWNMFAGSPDEAMFQSEFLPRLRVFSAQAQASALGPMLLQGLEDALHGLPPHPEQLLSSYADFLQHWWDGNDGTCLSEQTTEIEEIIRDQIHAKFPQLNFCEEYRNSLTQRVLDSHASYIVIPGIPQEMRSSALKTLLSKTHTEKFVILNDKILKEYPHEALFAVCSKLCDEVVLSTDTIDESLMTFVDGIDSKRNVNVRVLSSNWDKKMYSQMKLRFDKVNAWSEHWTLGCLESSEQQRILDNYVCFQGQKITLAELENVWPGLRQGIGDAALADLASGKTFQLGLPLQSVDETYVSRTVQHAVSLHNSVFQLRSAKDHFLLSGFPEKTLRELRRPDSPWEECSANGVPITSDEGSHLKPLNIESEIKTYWTELYLDGSDENREDENFENILGESSSKVKKYTGRRQKGKKAFWIPEEQKETNIETTGGKRNRHWILFENNELIWKKSEGDTKSLTDYVEGKSGHCKLNPICFHADNHDFLTWNDSTLILTDCAGMGKSTFISHISNVIKHADSSQWVIVVRMNDGQVMDELPEKMEISHVLRILKHYVGIGQTSSDKSAGIFLKNCIEETGHLTVLVDGVDEVCPSHKIKALKFLEVLKELLDRRRGRLWIASRSVLKQDLFKIVQKYTSVSLCPFSPQEQTRYLCNYWNHSENDSTLDLEFQVLCVVDAVRESTGKGDHSLCDVPLYTRMFAEAYSGEYIETIINQMTSRLNRVTLYKRFVEKTLGIVWAKAGLSESAQVNLNITSQDVLQKLGLYAAFECFGEREFLGKYFDDVLTVVNELKDGQEREKTAKTGIITHFVNGRPKFLHYTLAEYLAALWLLDKHSCLPQLTQSLYEGVFGEVRYFFDALLAEENLLHTAAIVGRVEGVRSSLLFKGEGVDDEDRGGRRALHLAVINGHTEIVRILLEKGAKVSVRDRILDWVPLRYLDTMLNSLTTEGDKESPESFPLLEIVDILLGTSANVEDAPRLLIEKKKFLHLAITADLPHLAEALIRKSGWFFIQRLKKKTYMHLAVKHGSLNVLDMLLCLGFPVNVISSDLFHNTPLHVAAFNGHSGFCRRLLRHGAKVDARDGFGRTALIEAAEQNHRFVCEVLLNCGADPNARNRSGETPLHQAVWNNHRSVCKVLLDCAADPNARDTNGDTPLHWAAWQTHQYVCEMLLDYGADPNARNEYGATALHEATDFNYLSVCELLLDCGADPNSRNVLGETPLHYAARGGFAPLCRYLVKRGSHAQTRNCFGKTAEEYAADRGHQLVVKVLRGLDPFYE